MKKYNIKNIKGKWVDFPDDKEVKLLLRPFSLFSFTKVPSDDSIDPKEFLPIFSYCVIDWKGFVDSDNNKLKCNDENKKIVFDYDQDIVIFVINEAGKIRDSVITEKEIKNSETSQPGETKKQEK